MAVLMTSQLIKIISSWRVSYGLSAQCKIISLRFNRTKTLGGFPPTQTPRLRPLYDGGGMNLLVRPRGKTSNLFIL